MTELSGVVVDWPAPPWVKAWSSCRLGGVSAGAYASLNLGTRCGDDPAHVAENRRRVIAALGVAPRWLKQVHGIAVAGADGAGADPAAEVEADASVTRTPGIASVVLTADCLPILFCHRREPVVAAAHAGWRGLAAGVIEATVASIHEDPAQLLAWLGPAIGPGAFEVGEEVRSAFLAQDPEASAAFRPGVPGKWWADLYQLARLRLQRVGVTSVYGGGLCTAGDPNRFYSHRRDRGVTGRMGSFVWLEPSSTAAHRIMGGP